MEPASIASPAIALAKWLSDLVLKRKKPHIHVKYRGEDQIQFWVAYQPEVPGEPLWTRVSWKGQRQRIGGLWPTAFDLPWGVSGDRTKSSYVAMKGAREAALKKAVSNGPSAAHGPVFDVTDEMLARWGTTDHLRACFGLDLRGLDKRKIRSAKIEIAVLGQTGERAKISRAIRKL